MNNKKIRYCLIIFLMSFVFGCSTIPTKTTRLSCVPKAHEDYYFALRHFRHGECDVALKQFQEVIRDYPNTEAAAKAQYMIAETLLKLSKREEALLAYQKALDLDAANYKAWMKIIELYKQFKNYEDVLKAYKKAIELISQKAKLKPIYVVLMKEFANFYLDKEEHLKAAKIYEQLILEGIMDEENLLTVGRYYTYAKEYERAEEVFNKLFEKYPDKYHREKYSSEIFRIYSGLGKDIETIDLSLEAMKESVALHKEQVEWDLIHAYETNDKLEKLMALLEDRIKEEPCNNELYLLLAATYKREQNYTLAIEYYEKALEFFPKEKHIYRNLGWLYNRLENYNKAIDYYEKLIELKPDSFTYYEVLAGVYYRLGKKKEALEVLEKLIEKNKGLNKSQGFKIAGNIYKRCEMYNEAIAFYEKAIVLSGNYYPPLALSLVECYYQTGNFIKTEELCKEIIEKGEKFPYIVEQAESFLLKFYNTPEKLYELIAKYEAILEKYKNLSKTEKEQEKEKTIDAGLFLSKVYLENNMPEEAVKVLKKLLEINSEQFDIYDKIADIYFYKIPKNTNKAIKWYKKAIQKNPEDNHVLLHLGYAYERKGMYNDASKVYVALVEKNQGDSFWEQCPRGRLESLKLIREKQLIKNWLVIGPFDNTGGKGFDTVYPPEKEINLDKIYEGKDGKQIKWFRAYKGKFGYVDFDEIFSPNEEAVAYALVYIESAIGKEVQFKMGSDDTITVWLNDEKVLSKKKYRWAKIDQDTVNVELRQGKNKVLIKICEGKIDWGFYFRVTDMNGVPIDDLKYSMLK